MSEDPARLGSARDLAIDGHIALLHAANRNGEWLRGNRQTSVIVATLPPLFAATAIATNRANGDYYLVEAPSG